MKNKLILIANSNPIHGEVVKRLVKDLKAIEVKNNDELVEKLSSGCSPEYIFFLHWSSIIPKTIYSKHECILFHMTDLPFGRGGSPLQNLIVRGHEMTKMSALKVKKGLDTGPIYLKKSLSLLGTAEEIFLRAGEVMEEMIYEIINKKMTPTEQIGESSTFKRRTPSQGNIGGLSSLKDLFDYIRMLDAKGYPNAFYETKSLRFEFSRASLKKNKLIADVRITEK